MIMARQVITDDRAGDDPPRLPWSWTSAWPRNITRAGKPGKQLAGHLFSGQTTGWVTLSSVWV